MRMYALRKISAVHILVWNNTWQLISAPWCVLNAGADEWWDKAKYLKESSPWSRFLQALPPDSPRWCSASSICPRISWRKDLRISAFIMLGSSLSSLRSLLGSTQTEIPRSYHISYCSDYTWAWEKSSGLRVGRTGSSFWLSSSLPLSPSEAALCSKDHPLQENDRHRNSDTGYTKDPDNAPGPRQWSRTRKFCNSSLARNCTKYLWEFILRNQNSTDSYSFIHFINTYWISTRGSRHILCS